MIVVDISAMMATLLGEPVADACIRILEAEEQALISAGIMAEALIVAASRNIAEEMSRLSKELGFEGICAS